VPEPETRPGWVKLRVKACSLNYLDIFSRRGMPGIKIPLPGITGGDCAGEVAEVGAGVEGVRVGERYVVKPGYVDFKRGILEIMGENRP
jgi:alcohol dehydrogenase